VATMSLLPRDEKSALSAAGGAGPAQVVDAYIKMVGDGIDVVNKISESLSQDARTIVIEIVNFTSRTLTKSKDDFTHRGFGPVLPKVVIGPCLLCFE
jgi:hypothetical protein